MNELLVVYLQHLFDSCRALWFDEHAVLATHTRWRSLKGKLRRAWDSISACRMSQPITSRVPIPKRILDEFSYYAVICAMSGDAALRPLWWCFTVRLRVSFEAPLRPRDFCFIGSRPSASAWGAYFLFPFDCKGSQCETPRKWLLWGGFKPASSAALVQLSG